MIKGFEFDNGARIFLERKDLDGDLIWRWIAPGGNGKPDFNNCSGWERIEYWDNREDFGFCWQGYYFEVWLPPKDGNLFWRDEDNPRVTCTKTWTNPGVWIHIIEENTIDD